MIKSSRCLFTVATLATLGNLFPTNVFAAGNRPAFTRGGSGTVGNITVADFNRDGLMDIAGAGRSAAVSVHVSSPSGGYRGGVVLQGSFRIDATAASDLDNDGHPDLLVVRWSEAARRNSPSIREMATERSVRQS